MNQQHLCERCGRSYEKERQTQRYCSATCRQLSWVDRKRHDTRTRTNELLERISAKLGDHDLEGELRLLIDELIVDKFLKAAIVDEEAA